MFDCRSDEMANVPPRTAIGIIGRLRHWRGCWRRRIVRDHRPIIIIARAVVPPTASRRSLRHWRNVRLISRPLMPEPFRHRWRGGIAVSRGRISRDIGGRGRVCRAAAEERQRGPASKGERRQLAFGDHGYTAAPEADAAVRSFLSVITIRPEREIPG